MDRVPGSRVTRRAVLAAAAVASFGISRATAAQTPEADLTPEQLAAAVFMLPVLGTALTADEDAWLRRWQPGGVILTGANIGTPDEVRALIAAIHATNPERPPLVAVDQEGGEVTRIADDPCPSAPELGLMPNAEVTRLSGERAALLRDYGIDVNFAPVADVGWSPEGSVTGRTFGSDPAVVSEKVAAFVEGADGSGVRLTAKHFPGHGRTSADSHEALPTIQLSEEEWLATDALPFRAAVEAGVPLVMLGHLVLTGWGDTPASISPKAVSALRETLGFEGGIVSDDLGMGALAEYGALDVVDRAIDAGIDLLLYVVTPLPPEELIGRVAERIASGSVSAGRLRASVRRVRGA